jgi:molybdopterin/thiamine biosynthesis adenylyltransferase
MKRPGPDRTRTGRAPRSWHDVRGLALRGKDQVSKGDLSDQQLLRYSRQILLPDVDVDGQLRLARARVLILGMGGLGSPVAMYLAGAGVGQLVLVDPDTVDTSNLHRQILHGVSDIGRAKVDSARDALAARNPDPEIVTFGHKLDEEQLLAQVELADVVVDGSDNFACRVAVNRACVQTRTPLVYGAVVGLEGQASVFRKDQDDSPCYQCLYSDLEQDGQGSNFENCSGQGVLGPVAGLIACIQATEALKILLDLGQGLQGRLLLLDARSMNLRSFRLARDPGCSVCSVAGSAKA